MNANREQTDFAQLREQMVRNQLMSRGIRDQGVLDAMGTIPREAFVPDEMKPRAYDDSPLPIGHEQTISQPYIVAEMSQALALTETDRVLEIGTGSGYQTAILAHIAQTVYTIEKYAELFDPAYALLQRLGYENVIGKCGDGTEGWPEESPFDAILVTAGAPEVPSPLLDQLKQYGRMVVPVGNRISQDLVRLTKEPDGIKRVSLGGCRFVQLTGTHGWQA